MLKKYVKNLPASKLKKAAKKKPFIIKCDAFRKYYNCFRRTMPEKRLSTILDQQL